MKLNVVTRYTYTIETVVQAGNRNLRVVHIPVTTNPQTRESRLFNSMWTYVTRSAVTILRLFALYEPLKVFTSIGLMTFSVGFAISLRFLYYYFDGAGQGHLQSLVLSAVLMIVGFQVLLIGLVADVISANRKLTEELLYRVRSIELTGRAANTAEAPDERPKGGD